MNVSDNIWTSDQERLLLQTTRKINHCGITFYETTEGFFLVPGEFNISLPQLEREVKTIQHLVLADIDYKELLNIKRANKLNARINTNLCKTLQMVLNIYAKQHNKYMTINDVMGNKLTLFNNDGLILLAECIEINNITVKTRMRECYIQPQVEVLFYNKRLELNLFEDGIISLNKDKTTDCNKRKMTFIDKSKIILTKNMTNEVVEIDNKMRDINTFEIKRNELKFSHSAAFNNSFDPIKQIEKLIKLREMNGHYYFSPEIQQYNTTSNIAETLIELRRIGNQIMGVLLTVIIVFIAVAIGYKSYKKYRKNKTKRNKFVVKFNKQESE